MGQQGISFLEQSPVGVRVDLVFVGMEQLRRQLFDKAPPRALIVYSGRHGSGRFALQSFSAAVQRAKSAESSSAGCDCVIGSSVLAQSTHRPVIVHGWRGFSISH